MQNQLIGVVVPVHNAAPFLPLCLSAIAAQTHKDLLCVLVDDGSTDDSADICTRFAARDPRFTLLRQPQSGVAAARAAGLRHALEQGVLWAAFCDADDLYHPQFLAALLDAADSTALPLACCRYDTFTEAPPADTAPADAKALLHPAHLEALLHDHAVDYSLCNKLYAAEILSPALLDNGFAYNEDLLANWQVFCSLPGCAFCDFAGYHYRQHPQSASHRPLAPVSIDEQRRAALYIREHAPEGLQQSANAFYYEKLVYLASMILRRADAGSYATQLNELAVGITAGLKDANLGRNPRLPFSIKAAAFATVHFPGLWQKICRRFLRDRA